MSINDEIDARLRRIAREQHRSYKDVVNDAIAHGIEAIDVAQPQEEYRVESSAFGLKPGIDPARLNQAYDDLESGV